MPAHKWTDDSNAALLTDLYQLTMLQAYHREQMNEEAVFDLFIRRLRSRNFLLSAGLDTVLHYLETIRFTDEAVDYLATLGLFDEAFLNHLKDFRFSGSVYAIPEGTPFFPDESVLQVVAPIQEAQLIETFILNQITFQTGIASKAARVVTAASGALVADFGARRMHGADAANRAVRAYHIAGIDSTSNVLGGMMYGIDVTGTMAHSYIEAFDTEREAFEAFVRMYPKTTLLVDTYDTHAAIRLVTEMAAEMGEAFDVGAIRLDSGDLAQLSLEARRILDDGGLRDVRILVSGSLDEYAIARLVSEEAPIDGYGVGTSMGTIADQPFLDSVYKLSAYAGEPRMKLSTSKSNLPGLKQVFRVYDSDGRASFDTIAKFEEEFDGEPLVTCVMRDGVRTSAGNVSLDEARAHARRSMGTLPSELLSLEKVDPEYEVRLSASLRSERDQLQNTLEAMAS